MAATKETEKRIDEVVIAPDDEYDTYLPIQYRKSNVLIGSKFKSTLLENKLLAISLANIPYNAEEGENGTLISTMKAADIRKLLNANKGSFYSQLNSAARSMTAKSIGYNDPENQKFEYIAVVIRAAYDKGYFTIEYNPHIKNYLTDIKANFTKLSLPIMLKFESVYSFRLYELLKSKAYIPKNMQSELENKNIKKFNIRISIAELKLTLGVVNAELESVKRVLNNSKTPNFDKAVEVSPEHMYTGMGDFKRRVIDVAIEEINRVSDMNVQYEPTRTRAGKVVGFIFKVEFKESKPVLTSEEKDEIIDMISDLIDQPLKTKDIRAIAEAAEYDFELVKRAYEGAEGSYDSISNFTGFMISAIKDNYYPEAVEPAPETKKKKKAGKKPISQNPFNQFKQNDYDFDQLEIELLSNPSGREIIDVAIKES